MYAKGSSSMQQTHFQNIHNTEESGKKRQPLAQNLNVVWKYEEEGFGKSLLHFPKPSKKCKEYNNEHQMWIQLYKQKKHLKKIQKKENSFLAFLTLRIWCTSVLFPPFFCFWPFLQSLRLLLHFTKATSDTSKLSLIYLDGLWKKKYCITGCSFYNIPREAIYQILSKKVNCLINAHWAFNKKFKSKVGSIQNFALIM